MDQSVRLLVPGNPRGLLAGDSDGPAVQGSVLGDRDRGMLDRGGGNCSVPARAMEEAEDLRLNWAINPSIFVLRVSRKDRKAHDFYIPVLLMILGTTFYHIAQKSVPTPVNPLFSLVMNYGTALVGTVLLIPLYPAR